jgi:hypothetical protein
MSVGSSSLLWLLSPPPETVAVLVIWVPLAPASTCTVRLMGAALLLVAIGLVEVQVTVPDASPQLQFVPPAETYVRPAGSTSVTVIVPLEAAVPLLETVMV